MYIPKRYGQSKIDKCPFCGKQAIALNKQKVPVCEAHKWNNLDEMKCSCGSYLEMKHGKFGVFFVCFKCGNKNLKQVLEINEPKDKSSSQNEITVRSDDPRYF
ncbi:MAG: hypothetical protein V1837_06015 [Candidatus Woesearchaeota archaeon]